MFMNNLVVSLVVFIAVATTGLPAGAVEGQTKIDGYLIDTLCADSHKDDSKDRAVMFLETHTRSCALMPACKSSGFSLYSEGKWYKLDDHGAELAAKFIKDAKNDRNFYVQVEGTLANNIVKTDKISKATPEN